MDSMEYRLSKFKNDIANQFGHNVFSKKVLIRVCYYLLEKRINTRILFLMTTYRRLLPHTAVGWNIWRNCIIRKVSILLYSPSKCWLIYRKTNIWPSQGQGARLNPSFSNLSASPWQCASNELLRVEIHQAVRILYPVILPKVERLLFTAVVVVVVVGLVLIRIVGPNTAVFGIIAICMHLTRTVFLFFYMFLNWTVAYIVDFN